MTQRSDGDRSTHEKALLIAIGAIAWTDATGVRRRVAGDALFADLIGHGVWFCPRRIDVEPKTPMLFYLNQQGCCGYAQLSGISSPEPADAALMQRFGIDQFPTKLSLTDIHTISPPLDLRPFIMSLDFIANKAAWGTALRSTPRLIPRSDFDTLMSAVTQR